MLTIVFYSTNGAAAKARARAISASKSDHARVYDAGVWDSTPDKCDNVEVMPDVTKWHRKKIAEVYGEPVEVDEGAVDFEQIHEFPRQQLGLMPQREEVDAKKIKHMGGGRWFVMRGEERLSGPHDKAEAQQLAAVKD